MTDDKKIHEKFVNSLNNGGLPYYDETKNNIYEKGWTACYKAYCEKIEPDIVYKDTPTDILISQAYYDKYPPLMDTENGFNFFKDGYIEGFNYIKNKYNLSFIKFSQDWEKEFQKTFPKIYLLDKETQKHYRDAFMEGFKAAGNKQFTIEDIMTAMIHASCMNGKVSDIKDRQIPEYINNLLNSK